MKSASYCSLLPELFRYKTTKVRLPKPQVILLDFHGTISERLWEDKVIYPYVREALGSYLRNNWNDDVIQRCLPALRHESFEQRFRNKFEDAPVITDPNEGSDEMEPAQLAGQMSDFLLWQMTSKKETHETLMIERSVWRDGLKRRQILTPIYDDVMPCVREWSEKYNCLIYIISSLDGEILKLLFENTNKGDLSRYVKDYVSPKKPGDKLSSELYKQFFDKLPIAKNRTSPQAIKTDISSVAGAKRVTSPTAAPALAGSSSSPNRPSSPGSRHHSKSPPPDLASRQSSPTSFERIAKPVLYLTDSGQEAKAANQVDDESVFECVLVNRPGNKRFRTYYLSQFAYIEKFDDIAFVC